MWLEKKNFVNLAIINFDQFKVNHTIFYDLKQFIHVVKLEMYESNIKDANLSSQIFWNNQN